MVIGVSKSVNRRLGDRNSQDQDRELMSLPVGRVVG